VDDFLQAAVPEPVQILGLEMRPFSLGHWLLLARFENGFLTGNVKLDDVILAVLICSMTFEEACVFMAAADRDEQIRVWSEKVKLQLKLAGETLNVSAKAELFSTYFKEGSKIPAYQYTDTGTSAVGCPWTQVLKVTLMSELGMSETEVLNRSLRLSWWDYLSWRELNNKGVSLADVEALQDGQTRADAFDAALRARYGDDMSAILKN